ncbi:hypothetical protein HOLDEFILI_01123 [Holdemania filiformis DSM 12042]|uniref:Uncharacterized protein n=1 Tax=Holdemania filiformis DSM 12042 TaxID=545696 RepID=B9Y5P1_9FIRM|nr:hypothetical protein HOLDEFILI_01123 [Holdemania filiformis DSM 12042]
MIYKDLSSGNRLFFLCFSGNPTSFFQADRDPSAGKQKNRVFKTRL